MSFAKIGGDDPHKLGHNRDRFVIPAAIAGQDRLKTMAGYEAAQRVMRRAGAITGAISGVAWMTRGRAFESIGRKRYHYDLSRGRDEEVGAASARRRRPRSRRDTVAPDRGRQLNSTLSPDRTFKGTNRSQSLDQRRRGFAIARAVTTDGQRYRPHQDTTPRAGLRRRKRARVRRCGVARQPQLAILPVRTSAEVRI